MEKEHSLPRMPETLDGWAVLHEMFRIDWKKWKKLSAIERRNILSSAEATLGKITRPERGQSACFAMLGHKADLMFVHFRDRLEDLSQAELHLRQCALFDYLVETTSYVSFVELGMYEMTLKIHEELVAAQLEPGSDEWQKRWAERLQDQRNRMGARIYPEIPSNRYICFYPMNKRRGETVNWYDLPIHERQLMMREHGMIGRKYSGQVTQVISGSIGFDNWEWGVDLFSDDPLVFKRLVYEMRFDKASSLYGEFGEFYIGIQMDVSKLPTFMNGQYPESLGS